MSNFKRMDRTRRRAYRSRHRITLGSTGTMILIIFLIAVILFTVAVMIGLNLRRQAESIGSSTTVPETSWYSYDTTNIPNVIARSAEFGKAPQPLGVLSTPSEDTETPVKVKRSYNAYSTVVRRCDGAALYSSDYIRRIASLDGSSPSSLDELSDSLSKFEGCYTSAVFYVTFRDAPQNIRASLREHEISLAAEICRSGFDDILLMNITTSQDAELAAEFCRSLRERCDTQPTKNKCKIGVSIDFDLLASSSAREWLRSIENTFDFLALDIQNTENADPAAYSADVSEKIEKVLSLVGIYKIRILVSDAPGAASAALSAGAINVAEISAPLTEAEASGDSSQLSPPLLP